MIRILGSKLLQVAGALAVLTAIAGALGCSATNEDLSPNTEQAYVDMVHRPEQGKVDIYMGGQFFTSYLYEHELLNKPVLFPLMSANGQTLTRGYPLATREGESTDHTHHHGIWFNHGEVNGIDFWNAGRTPPVSGVRYGKIEHTQFQQIQSGNKGQLIVNKTWVDDNAAPVLDEQTTYTFSGDDKTRVITLAIELTARESDIHFEDSKEALFGIRVADELRINTGEFSGATGHYRNSEGVEGYPDVWGKRASWMQLAGELENAKISLIIFDDIANINHPPHWMARDYGLFAVNNLGSKAYGDTPLNYVLPQHQSQTFRYQIIVASDQTLTVDRIRVLYDEFISPIK